MDISFDVPGSIGIVADLADEEIAQDAWSEARNVRFEDGRVIKMTGDSLVATATASALWCANIATPTDNFWVYATHTQLYARLGATHTNISRTASYSATGGWSGGRFNGFGVFCDGASAPQQWVPGTGNACTNLQFDSSAGATDADWGSASYTTRVMRPFKEYLVAGDITDPSGTRNGSLVWWSHPAQQGTLPQTWDFNKPAYDSGRYEVEGPGDVVDMAPMGNVNVVYKSGSTWAMRPIGAPDIFGFTRAFESFGLLGLNCAAPFMRQHLAVGTEDVILHNLQGHQYPLESRMNKFLYRELDTTNFGNTFVVANYRRKEIWICFPQSGATFANLAIIWNWKHNTVTVRELDDIGFIAAGVVDTGAEDLTFDGDTGTFEEAEGAFDDQTYDPNLRRLMMARPASSELLQADNTNQFNGSNMDAWVQRIGLPIGRQTRRGILVDPRRINEISEIIPRITGTAGGQITVRVGGRDRPGQQLFWDAEQTFVIGTDYKVDCRVARRIPAIEFRSSSNIEWALEGYQVVAFPGGER